MARACRGHSLSSSLCGRGEAGGQTQASAVNGVDHSLGRVRVVGAGANADCCCLLYGGAGRPRRHIVDVERGGGVGKAIACGRKRAVLRQVDEHIALSAAIRHRSVGVANAGGRQGANTQIVHRGAGRG